MVLASRRSSPTSAGRATHPGRVLVAMSGGVDSSVAAALLHEQGVETVGVWMRLHDVADTYSEFKKSCCSLDAAEDARRVAGQLGIPFYILNLEREFGAGVLQPFLDAYQAGGRRAPASTATAPSSSARSPGALGGCTTARRSRPGTTPGSMRSTMPTLPMAGATDCSKASTPTRTRATSCTACARTSWPTAAFRSAS